MSLLIAALDLVFRYDLPDEFSFPHYFGVSLDALTADLVELLPSS